MPAKDKYNGCSPTLRKWLKSLSLAQLQGMVVEINKLQGFLAPGFPCSEADLIMHSRFGAELSAPRPKNPNKVVKKKAAPAPAKRPLNSWMAFRSYYSPIFISQQQKDISGFLTKIWQEDPFHAKWSILAKAYSDVREDVGKSLAPLDKFLALTGPYIGIIGPDEYLSELGWEIVSVDNDMAIKRKFKPDLSSFNDSLRTSNLSANDILRYCHQTGYMARIPGHQNLASSSKLTMASLPAPNNDNHTPSEFLPEHSPFTVVSDANALMPVMPFDEFSNDFALIDTPQNQSPFVSGPSWHSSFYLPNIDPSMYRAFHVNTIMPTVVNTNCDFDESQTGSNDDFQLPDNYGVQMMEEQHAIAENSGSQFPYYEHFDPAQLDDDLQLFWDPNCGDAFDAFDVSEWRSAYDS